MLSLTCYSLDAYTISAFHVDLLVNNKEAKHVSIWD